MGVLAFIWLPLIMASFFVPSKGNSDLFQQGFNYGGAGGRGVGDLNYGGSSYANSGRGYGFGNNDNSQILNSSNQRGYGGNDLSQLLGTNANSNIGFGNNNLYGGSPQSALASKLSMLNQPTTGFQGIGIQDPQAIHGLVPPQNAQGINGLLQGGTESLFPNQAGGYGGSSQSALASKLSILNQPTTGFQGAGTQDPQAIPGLLPPQNAQGIIGLLQGGGGSLFPNQVGGYGSSQSALASKLPMLNKPTTGFQGTGIQDLQAIYNLQSSQNAQGINGLLQGGSGSLFPNQVGGSMLNLPNMSYQGPGSQDPARLLSALNAPGINGLIPGGGGSMYQNQSGLDSLFPGGSPFSNLQGGYNSGSLAGYETLNVQNIYRGKFLLAKERAEAKKQTALTEFYKKVQAAEGDLQKEVLDLTKEMSEKLAEVQHKELKERLNDQFNRSTAYLNRLT